MTLKSADELSAVVAAADPNDLDSRLSKEVLLDLIESGNAVGGTLVGLNVPLQVTTSWAPVSAFTDAIGTKGLIPDLALGKFTVASGGAGSYAVDLAISVISPANGKLEFAVTKNGSLTDYRTKFDIDATKDEAGSIVGTGPLNVGDEVVLAVKANQSGTITMNSGQFRLLKG